MQLTAVSLCLPAPLGKGVAPDLDFFCFFLSAPLSMVTACCCIERCHALGDSCWVLHDASGAFAAIFRSFPFISFDFIAAPTQECRVVIGFSVKRIVEHTMCVTKRRKGETKERGGNEAGNREAVKRIVEHTMLHRVSVHALIYLGPVAS
jgi:hypothetical protein